MSTADSSDPAPAAAEQPGLSPAAQYRASGQARPEPPRPPVSQEEERAGELARLAAAAQRSVERTLASYQESTRREEQRVAAEQRALEALQIEAEVRAGTRPEAEVIPFSRATRRRARPEPPEGDETLERAEQLATLASDTIDMLYRPVCGPDPGRVVAVSASVRWRHPQHGVMPSDALISAAEHAGLRRALEERLLDSICADIARLRAAPDGDDLAAHVPLPSLHLADERLATVVERTLRRHELPGSALVLQITEDGPSPDLAQAARVLDRVRALGVGVGLEAFGAGPGGLAFLTHLPVGWLVLDPSLTSAEPDSRAAAVLSGTVALAESLRLTLLADGVSDREQADRLRQLGIGMARGPLYGAPVPLPELDLTRLSGSPERFA